MKRQNQTDQDTLENLTTQQIRAIELLIAGANVSDVAKEIGIARQTVSKWANQDSHFQAELNTRRYEMWNGLTDRLRGLLPKALEVVENELQNSDDARLRMQAALSILKLASVEMPPKGLTDAAEIENAKNSIWGW